MYKLTFRPGGQILQLDQHDNVLAAALERGFQLPHKCKRGDCGTCKAKLLKGTVDQSSDLPALKKLSDGEILLCSSRAESDLELFMEGVLAPGEIAPQHFDCSVAEITPLSPGVLKVLLRHDAFPAPTFFPGQYLQLMIDGNKRPYSIASPPENEGVLELNIRLIPGQPVNEDTLAWLKDHEQVSVELPFGGAILDAQSQRPVLFIAGGTGFAPFKSIIESALANQVQREMHLFWGAAQPEELYYDSLAKRWAKFVPHFSYTPVISLPNDDWQGATGLVHEQALRDIDNIADYDVFLSGSMEMVRAVYKELIAAGLPREQLFSDMADIVDLAAS